MKSMRTGEAVKHEDSTFGRRLRAAIDESPLSQEGVAREVGVSLRSVQSWCSESKPKEPKGRHLVALAEVLDRDPSWFYGEEKAA